MAPSTGIPWTCAPTQTFVIIQKTDDIEAATTTQFSFKHGAGTSRTDNQHTFETFSGRCNCSSVSLSRNR